MADPLTWAGGPKPTSESWVIENADRSGGPSLTGSEQIVSAVSGRWKGKLTFQLIREEVLWLRALVAGLDGRAGAVLVGPFDLIGMPIADAEEPWAVALGLVGPAQNHLPFGSGAVHGTLAVAAELMDRSISIAMVAGRAPQPGNYVGLGQNLHVIVSVTGSGPFICGIRPGLRDDAAPGSTVTFSEPLARMRLASVPDLPVTGGDHVTNVSLDLVEAF